MGKVVEKKHTEGAVAAEENLIGQVKQLSVCAIEFKSEVLSGEEVMGDLKIKSKAVEKRAENVAYEKNDLQDCSQQSQDGQYNVCGFIDCVQGTVHCCNTEQKKVQGYIYRRTDEESRKILKNILSPGWTNGLSNHSIPILRRLESQLSSITLAEIIA